MVTTLFGLFLALASATEPPQDQDQDDAEATEHPSPKAVGARPRHPERKKRFGLLVRGGAIGAPLGAMAGFMVSGVTRVHPLYTVPSGLAAGMSLGFVGTVHISSPGTSPLPELGLGFVGSGSLVTLATAVVAPTTGSHTRLADHPVPNTLLNAAMFTTAVVGPILGGAALAHLGQEAKLRAKSRRLTARFAPTGNGLAVVGRW